MFLCFFYLRSNVFNIYVLYWTKDPNGNLTWSSYDIGLYAIVYACNTMQFSCDLSTLMYYSLSTWRRALACWQSICLLLDHLKANTHCRRDVTRQLSRVCVGGVYWGSFGELSTQLQRLQHYGLVFFQDLIGGDSLRRWKRWWWWWWWWWQ